MDYRILFMDEDQDRMYVGCKDHVLSMDINNISQNTLKVREQLTLLYINMKRSRTLLQMLKPMVTTFSSFTSHLTNGREVVCLNTETA